VYIVRLDAAAAAAADDDDDYWQISLFNTEETV